MASSGNQKQEAGLFARLVVILLALGVVLLGTAPIRARYGSMREFLRQETSAFAKSKNWNLNHFKVNDILSADSKTSKEQQEAAEKTKKQQTLDALSEKDRKSLDKLINGL